MHETTPASPSRARNWIDPHAVMSIKSLEMRARIVVQGFWSGLHRSPYHGFSVEFSEYRQYSPGDDTRFLDWKLFARSDRYYLKRFHDETNLRCHLVVDQSRSMEYGSIGHTKGDYARTLAATLGHFLNQQGDAIGLLTFDERVREYLPARNRMGHLRQLMLALERSGSGARTDLSLPLKRIAEIIQKRGLVVLISDLLAPLETLENDLGALAATGHEVMVFQLLDPAEVTFGFQESVQFQDIESGRTLYIDPAAARSSYLKKLEDHLVTIETLCRNRGIGFSRFKTDRPLDQALFDFLKARMQRGKTKVRKRNPMRSSA
jgi:uncharacterized protein (DUF58 family)